ncbi:hypothetical protein TIFTF001_017364 [Ficus carica]|uniref:Uncharacterized protein n=1 Tax=Ficus carica TaxID=3494 RepID=A0AA88A9D6_FICCA|nr:hypothetical protein TIFTF001_017364 [Ficus carica]
MDERMSLTPAIGVHHWCTLLEYITYSGRVYSTLLTLMTGNLRPRPPVLVSVDMLLQDSPSNSPTSSEVSTALASSTEQLQISQQTTLASSSSPKYLNNPQILLRLAIDAEDLLARDLPDSGTESVITVDLLARISATPAPNHQYRGSHHKIHCDSDAESTSTIVFACRIVAVSGNRIWTKRDTYLRRDLTAAVELQRSEIPLHRCKLRHPSSPSRELRPPSERQRKEE